MVSPFPIPHFNFEIGDTNLRADNRVKSAIATVLVNDVLGSLLIIGPAVTASQVQADLDPVLRLERSEFQMELGQATQDIGRVVIEVAIVGWPMMIVRHTDVTHAREQAD